MSIESLVIGLNGYDPSNLLTLLADLQSLHHFYLDLTKSSELPCLGLISPEAVTVYLKNAPSALQSLEFPSQLWRNLEGSAGASVKHAEARAGAQVTRYCGRQR